MRSPLPCVLFCMSLGFVSAQVPSQKSTVNHSGIMLFRQAAQINTQTRTEVKAGSNVALNVLTTARAKEYCYAGATDDLMDDLRAYMTLNRVPLSNAADAGYNLSVIVDRPLSKHIELTVQARDGANALRWTETVIWHKELTRNDTVRVLDRIHDVINAKLRTLQAIERIN